MQPRTATAAKRPQRLLKDAEGDAMTARNAANDANDAAMGATTSDDAEMYQMRRNRAGQRVHGGGRPL